MSQAINNLTADQLARAEKAAHNLQALADRLRADDSFAASLKADPRGALADAGLALEQEAMEALIVADPARFDMRCESLFDLVDSDFLLSMSNPCCG